MTATRINETADMVSVVGKHIPAVAGKWNGRMTPEVPCPKCGGKTRFRLRRCRNGLLMAFCSHCAENGLTAIKYIEWYYGYSTETAIDWWRNNDTVRVIPSEAIKPVDNQPLNLAIALRCHNGMDPRAREYMYRRGMTDKYIDHFKVGYHRGYRRYSFPLIIDKCLWGIQYRLNPRIEAVLKFLRCFEDPEHKVNIVRYVSETGSHNHNIYGTDEIRAAAWPYAILIEGVPDVVAMWSCGFPAFSTFQGNNRAKPWDYKWNKHLASINTVYVIPDNDQSGSGEFFASEKVKAIGARAHIHWLPKDVKDIGEFIQQDLPTATQRLSAMLKLPPMKDLIG